MHDTHVVAACFSHRFSAAIQELLRESYATSAVHEPDYKAVHETGWRRDENPRRRRRSRRQELAKFIFLDSHITHDVLNT